MENSQRANLLHEAIDSLPVNQKVAFSLSKYEDLSYKEISEIIETQYQRAIKILTENKDKLITLAEVLLEKEVIFKKDLEVIFGKRPFAIEEIEVKKVLQNEVENTEKTKEEPNIENSSKTDE